jgi:hypothetical protein
MIEYFASTEADGSLAEENLLERLEGWNEDSIRLLVALLDRIAELPDAEATALTERILAEIDDQLH